MLCIFTPKSNKISQGPCHVAESYMYNCDMFTQFYEEYWLEIVVNTFLLYN